MHSEINSLPALFKQLGRCNRCIRKAFLTSLGAWAAYALGLSAGLPDSLQAVTGIAAIGLSALWLAHLTAHTLRTGLRPSQGSSDFTGRRETLGLMARALGIGVLASVPLALLPEKALAFCGQCTKDADCGVGFSCKNTAPVNSGTVCNECVKD